MPAKELQINDPFPELTREDWRAAVGRERRGATYQSLVWQTDEGIHVPPLFTREDCDALPHRTPNIARLLERRTAWTVRQRITNADPSDAAEAAARAVAHGAEELELCLDLFAHGGDQPEPDDVDDDYLVGEGGIAAYRAKDLQSVFDAIDMRRTAVSIDAGAATLGAFASVLQHADEQGLSRKNLSGNLGLDPIGGIEPRDAAAEKHLGVMSKTLAFCAKHCPGFRPFTLDGRAHHEGSAVGELSALMATAAAHFRSLLEGGHDADTIARGTSLRIPVSTQLLVEIAKLRATRLLWAKLSHAFGADAPDAQRAQIVGTTSYRSLSQEFDLRTNLIRTTIQAFAAGVGGCDVIAIDPFDVDPDYADASSMRLARNQHHLMRQEAGIGQAGDAVAGSFAIERLTHEIASRAWQRLQEIEACGGCLSEEGDGLIAQHTATARNQRMERHRRRIDNVIGISRYIAVHEDARRPELDRAALHAKRVADLDARGDSKRADGAADKLRRAARSTKADVVEPTLVATAAGCTFAEIATALLGARSDDALDHETVAPSAVDQRWETFEDQRAAEATRGHSALLLPFGAPADRRARAEWAADLFRAGGFTVVDRGEFENLAEAIAAIEACSPDLVVLCSDDTSRAEYASGLAALRGPLLVVAGEPSEDVDRDRVTFVFEGADVLRILGYLSLRLTAQTEDEVHETIHRRIRDLEAEIDEEARAS